MGCAAGTVSQGGRDGRGGRIERRDGGRVAAGQAAVAREARIVPATTAPTNTAATYTASSA